jgi:aspartyl-tRNA(Asn)/glutamyl-tRNA(Gln) amidotransferase subunit A
VRLYGSLHEVQSDLRRGAITLPELVNYYLQRIAESDHLNAFIEVWAQQALTSAQAIQQKWTQGNAGPLAGMILGIKDNLLVKGFHASAGSRMLSNFTAPYTAACLQPLLDQDAIFIGRLNCDEFSMGSSGETSFHGPTLHPLNNGRVPGGSSSGAAAAVAADLCLAAIGSDTGGSVRQPAALNGVVGYKPSYGTVSRSGLIAYACSFDQVGPITRCVDDAEVLIRTMALGNDQQDATYSGWKSGPQIEKPYKVGVFQQSLHHHALHPEIKSKLRETINLLKAEGHTVDELDFPWTDYIVPTYYVLTTAEAASNLQRYDGIRFGYRTALPTDDWGRMVERSRTEGFGAEVKRRILLGNFVLSAGHYDAFYGKAQRIRRKIKEATDTLFERYDVLLSPVTCDEAFDLGCHDKDPVAMYLEDIFTVHANLTGMCAISLPMGKKSSGMPFGLQWSMAAGSDEALFAYSRYVSRLSEGF